MTTQFYYDLADWMVTFTLLGGVILFSSLVYLAGAYLNRLFTPKSTRTVITTMYTSGGQVTRTISNF
jgi:hypothetical protein